MSAGRRLFLVSVKVRIQRRCYLYIFQLCVDENRSLFEFVHTFRVDGQTRGYNQGMSPLYFLYPPFPGFVMMTFYYLHYVSMSMITIL